ncbi:hypothetical protein EV421DRAFT_1841174 [Armillaria borealis]|uniref:Uncharacterized protein n=1 Tax=Armillaria borealis TaxID=47425 RepID=A0AA39MGQ3_9AGAR|nr:hypothetical protein EV421DRAFT_1841174 [Armillaria borealis]
MTHKEISFKRRLFAIWRISIFLLLVTFSSRSFRVVRSQIQDSDWSCSCSKVGIELLIELMVVCECTGSHN